MKYHQVLFITAVVLLLLMLLTSCSSPGSYSFNYPDTKKVDTTDNYHGTVVADPYRWLEDLDSPETAKWVEAQNSVTMPYLKQLPGREIIKNRLKTLWDYPKYGVPVKESGLYLYRYNDGLQNQSVLMVADELDAEPRVLIDPNTLSEDGTVSLNGYDISPDGKYIAYSISRSGSDWREFYIRDIATGEDLGDHLEWIKFSGMSWSADGSGFYYSRYPTPGEGESMENQNKNMKVYFHQLGTQQSSDRLVYERPDNPDWGFVSQVTHDGNYLAMSVWKGTDTRNRFYYKDLTKAKSKVVELLNDFDAMYNFVGNKGAVFYFHTNLEAPMGRVIAIDITEPGRSNWREIVPEVDNKLSGVTMAGEKLVLSYLKDAHSLLQIHSLDGTLEKELSLPSLGTVSGVSGKPGDNELFYSFSSFSQPSTIYRYNLSTRKTTVFKEPEVAFEPGDYITEQIFYESKDGTQVPMFIVRHKDVDATGNNPTLLYGYGGFNISLTPRFNVGNLVWMEQGGIYALANIRGGGEYGEAWHKAGTKEKKQNVFDDFIAAANYLIDNGYTSSQKLAIEGGSNGGLLVGAVMTQQPDLFAVALPAVGVMDMLRYHKFTIGWAWASDYGRSDNPEDFEYLYAYSPLHNLEQGVDYPATLVTTADHDDRVVPSHSFKFISTLQEKHAGSDPVLIRIETKAGHGAGKPTEKVIAEECDKIIFTAYHTGLHIN